MVVQGPSDYNILLGRDYVYNMEDIVSTLFRVMCFPDEGKVVTVPGPSIAQSQSSSLNGPFTSTVSLEPSFHPPDSQEQSGECNEALGACT